MDRAQSLDRVIDALLDSYQRHGNINHLGAESLPSRARVTQLLDALIDLVLPGYFGDTQHDQLSLRYAVGERAVRVLRQLEDVCLRTLRAECCATSGTGASAKAEAHAAAAALGLLE